MRLKRAIQTAISEKSFHYIKYYFSKDNKEEKAALKRCMKRVKATRKKMKKLIKTYGPWEWGYVHDFIILAVNDMYEFYNEGDNVWQSDDSRLETVNQLLKAKELIDEVDKFENGERKFEDFLKKGENYLEAEQKAYDDFYTYLGKYIRWWWD